MYYEAEIGRRDTARASLGGAPVVGCWNLLPAGRRFQIGAAGLGAPPSPAAPVVGCRGWRAGEARRVLLAWSLDGAEQVTVRGASRDRPAPARPLGARVGRPAVPG